MCPSQRKAHDGERGLRRTPTNLMSCALVGPPFLAPLLSSPTAAHMVMVTILVHINKDLLVGSPMFCPSC
uniref:Uncharacterized protein n=1 Tax=Hordeum vulgare subsp. vulgare TaxID=112509 RepID=A0A8I7B0B3_HORVV